jgi:DNA-binding Lrp family transcriptional regulator
VISTKDTSLKLISELMKNSRRSDRELAKVVGVSQPTVSRLISKLEKEGFIKEYTMIPDFRKLGYELVALTFVRLRNLTPEELEKARQRTRTDMETAPPEIVWFEKGMGAGSDGVLASFHKDYASYLKLRERMKAYPFIESSESFLINLKGEIHYRPLTFSTLADHIMGLAEREPE